MSNEQNILLIMLALTLDSMTENEIEKFEAMFTEEEYSILENSAEILDKSEIDTDDIVKGLADISKKHLIADRKYSIVRESWWDSNGCDCCEPVDVGIYYIKRDGANQLNVDGGAIGFHDEVAALTYLLENLAGVEISFEDESDE